MLCATVGIGAFFLLSDPPSRGDPPPVQMTISDKTGKRDHNIHAFGTSSTASGQSARKPVSSRGLSWPGI